MLRIDGKGIRWATHLLKRNEVQSGTIGGRQKSQVVHGGKCIATWLERSGGS